MTTSQTDLGSTFGSLYMVLAALFFALMMVLIKMAGIRFGMHAHEMTFWRVAFSVVVLGLYSYHQKRNFRTNFPKQHLWRSLSGTVALLLNFYVILHLPLATAGTLQNTSALFLGLLSIIILKQKPTLLAWLSLGVGFVGVVLLLKPTPDNQPLPMFLGLMSGALSGYAYLQVRELSLLGEPAWRIVFYFALLATLISGLISCWVGFTPIKSPQMAFFITAIGMTALLGQLLMTYAYQVGRKFVVASLSYLTVVFALVFGMMMFDERLDAMSVIGILMIVGAGILSSKK